MGDYYPFREKTVNDYLSTRREEILRLRTEGESYAEIGRKFNISRERVRAIIFGKYPCPHKKKSEKDMFTVQALAKYLGVHPNSIRRWESAGILTSIRIGERRDRRFPKEDIEKLAMSQNKKYSPSLEEKRTLSVNEVASYLGIDPVTVRKWQNIGRLPGFVIGKRRIIRFLKEDVEKLEIEQRKTPK
jgi:excisionase family DNA binding protein